MGQNLFQRKPEVGERKSLPILLAEMLLGSGDGHKFLLILVAMFLQFKFACFVQIRKRDHTFMSLQLCPLSSRS